MAAPAQLVLPPVWARATELRAASGLAARPTLRPDRGGCSGVPQSIRGDTCEPQTSFVVSCRYLPGRS